MKVIGSMVNQTVKVRIRNLMALFIRGLGTTTSQMGLASRYKQMEANMKGNISMAISMDLANNIAAMGAFMKVSSKTILSKVKEPSFGPISGYTRVTS